MKPPKGTLKKLMKQKLLVLASLSFYINRVGQW